MNSASDFGRRAASWSSGWRWAERAGLVVMDSPSHHLSSPTESCSASGDANIPFPAGTSSKEQCGQKSNRTCLLHSATEARLVRDRTVTVGFYLVRNCDTHPRAMPASISFRVHQLVIDFEPKHAHQMRKNSRCDHPHQSEATVASAWKIKLPHHLTPSIQCKRLTMELLLRIASRVRNRLSACADFLKQFRRDIRSAEPSRHHPAALFSATRTSSFSPASSPSSPCAWATARRRHRGLEAEVLQRRNRIRAGRTGRNRRQRHARDAARHRAGLVLQFVDDPPRQLRPHAVRPRDLRRVPGGAGAPATRRPTAPTRSPARPCCPRPAPASAAGTSRVRRWSRSRAGACRFRRPGGR